MKYQKIGIVIADRDEYEPFLLSVKKFGFKEYRYFDRRAIEFSVFEKPVIAVYSGVGKVNAAAAAMHLIDVGCDCILNFGLSGGIDAVSRGGFCLPDKFTEHDFNLENIGYKPYEKPDQDYYIYEADENLSKVFLSLLGDISRGTAVSGDSFICDANVSRALFENVNAYSCDMETAAIAAVCRMANVPFCALRRISDDAGDDAIEIYREMNENEGSLLTNVFVKCLEEVCK